MKIKKLQFVEECQHQNKKNDLENQIMVLKQYAVSRGYKPKIYTDIGSGLNQVITDVINGNIPKVIISHKDRLTRFGFGYSKSFFELFGTEIEVINLEDDKLFQEELTEDLIVIIHHFSMKFYGKLKNQTIDFENTLKNFKKR